MREDLFEKIDTKEKAYLLGLLFADGWIERDKKSLRLGFRTKKEDRELINKLCRALNLDPQKYIKPVDKNMLRLRKGNKKLTSDLIKQGLIPGKEKSKNIEFPKLDSLEMELAFILGFYDGDGTQNTTKISTGSRIFLEQIKEKFNISNKISEEFGYGGKIGERKIIGDKFDFNLGVNLFNQMMDNFKGSLIRKRRYFATKEEKSKKAAESTKNSDGKTRKFNITKEELQKIIWEKPSEQIAKEYGVSGRLITKRCQQWEIKKPPRGYWAKKRSKKKS